MRMNIKSKQIASAHLERLGIPIHHILQRLGIEVPRQEGLAVDEQRDRDVGREEAEERRPRETLQGWHCNPKWLAQAAEGRGRGEVLELRSDIFKARK